MTHPRAPLGIDALTESVYRAMLAHPAERPAELAARLSLTEAQVVRATEVLNRLALVRRSDETPGHRRPVRPAHAMELLLARQEALLEEYAAQVSLSRAAAAQLIAEAAGPGSAAVATGRGIGTGLGAGVEVLIGLDEIRDRLATLSEHVAEELLSFAPDGAQTEENMRASRPINARLLERGVRLRTVYLTSIRSKPPTLAHAQRLADAGGQVRTVATLPTRMLILDRRIAVLPVDDHDSRRGAVVLSVSGIVAVLCALFESVWAEGEPLEASVRTTGRAGRARTAGPAGPAGSGGSAGTVAPAGQAGTTGGTAGAGGAAGTAELSAQELATLRLMATGHTLGGIAKRLGVSPRTARRITASLLERLETSSRFEAGVRAVQRGWLPVDG